MRACNLYRLLLAGLVGIVIAVIGGRAVPAETLILRDGQRLQGLGRGIQQGRLLWELNDGSTIAIPLAVVDRVKLDGDPEAVFREAGDEQPVVQSLESPAVADDRDGADGADYSLLRDNIQAFANTWKAVRGGFETWTKRAELGGRWNDGNAEQEFLDVKLKLEREKGNWLGQVDIGGQYSEADGEPKTNRWWGNVNYDYGRKAKWIVFAAAKNEHDVFEKLNYRGTYSTGAGYRFYNEDDRRLIVRLGPGFTWERFRDPHRERATPDLFGELEADWPLVRFVSVETKTTVHPSLQNFNVLRIVSDNGVLVKLDDDGRWKFKLGFRYEYTEQPSEERQPDDYTTSLLLVYTRK